MHWSQHLLCRVLRQSPHIPQHVAFIMDGNRRFAKQHHVHTFEGHARGYDKLKETLEWCLELGVRMVTVYAFSTDNFKRTPEEVAQLMRLAKMKFMEMMERLDIIERHGCCVRVLGNLNLMPDDVRAAMEGAVAASRHKTRVILNICMSYGHQQELTDATHLIAGAIEEGVLQREDVDANLLQAAMYTGISASLSTEAAAAAASAHHTAAGISSPAAAASPLPSDAHLLGTPDLLIRTSGETRLSDFLSSQVCRGDTQLVFLRTFWPDFSLLEMGRVILEYQRVAGDMHRQRARRRRKEKESQLERDVLEARRQLQEARRRGRICTTSEIDDETDPLLSHCCDFPARLASRGSSSCSDSSSSSSSSVADAATCSSALTTSSEDSNSDVSDDADGDATSSTHSARASPTAAHEQRWRDAEQAVSALVRRRGGAGAAAPTEVDEDELDVDLDDAADDTTFNLSDSDIAERVASLRQAREERIRAFAAYACQHTTSLV